jgi:hypothetical protein
MTATGAALHLHATHLLDVEEGEVAEPSHPYITGDHDTDGIVDLLGVIVVIHKKHKLHPPFPFLRLVAVQYVHRFALPHKRMVHVKSHAERNQSREAKTSPHLLHGSYGPQQ